MEESALRRKVQRKSKIRGYTLKVDALDDILSFASRFSGAQDDAVELLLDQLDHESLKSSIIDKDAVRRVVDLLVEAEAAVDETPDGAASASALRVIDAFLIPKFRYDPVKKLFYQHNGNLPIHGEILMLKLPCTEIGFSYFPRGYLGINISLSLPFILNPHILEAERYLQFSLLLDKLGESG